MNATTDRPENLVGGRGTITSWTTQQLVAFLGAVSACRDETSAVQTAAESVAMALDAEVGAVVVAGRVAGCVGFGRTPVPDPDLLAACTTGQGLVEIPGVGGADVITAKLGRVAQGHLLAARVSDPFAAGERATINAMAAVLGLSLDVLSALEAERRAREESEHHTAQVIDLLQKVREQRQLTLDRFSRIQRAIAARRPLTDVLDAIAATAREIVECDVAVVRISAHDLVCGAGLSEEAMQAVLSTQEHGDLGTRAERLREPVVDNSFGERDEADRYGSPRLCGAVAVPIHNGPVTVGHLMLGARQPGYAFSSLEASLATTLAEHAGLAVQDAETVGALHDALADAMHKASHDPLTGLANRATFLHALDATLPPAAPQPDLPGPDEQVAAPPQVAALSQVAAPSRPAATNSVACVLYIDLDYFKNVNDTYGHLVGDQLLVVTASRLRGAVRDDDVVARLGGDEFAVLLRSVRDPAEAQAVAQRVYTAVCRPAQLHGESLWPSASIGAAPAQDGDTPTTLLARADLALYQAKRSGRGQVAMYRPDLEASGGDQPTALIPAARHAHEQASVTS